MNADTTGDSIAPRQAFLCPVELDEANAFVRELHRHHEPVVGHKYSIGLHDGKTLRGVIITGRPVARHNQNGVTLEVTRCCTDGVKNGCSKLYRASWRVALNLGYLRLITYILASENGASLKAAGFRLVGIRGGGSWNRPDRPRTDKHPTGQKLLWELQAA